MALFLMLLMRNPEYFSWSIHLKDCCQVCNIHLCNKAALVLKMYLIIATADEQVPVSKPFTTGKGK